MKAKRRNFMLLIFWILSRLKMYDCVKLEIHSSSSVVTVGSSFSIICRTHNSSLLHQVILEHKNPHQNARIVSQGCMVPYSIPGVMVSREYCDCINGEISYLITNATETASGVWICHLGKIKTGTVITVSKGQTEDILEVAAPPTEEHHSFLENRSMIVLMSVIGGLALLLTIALCVFIVQGRARKKQLLRLLRESPGRQRVEVQDPYNQYVINAETPTSDHIYTGEDTGLYDTI
ncbi:uncharacterized protein LOC141905133 [Tubulanus polymorphus]|uniref:uncharacterized protein LOC141905133 n=1 Tax=Tubulanus polymorphus TaxID=672921 RepID=UPI003DA630EB